MSEKKRLVQTETYNSTESLSVVASLSPASASLQPGHKLLGRLVLQVGTHIAGVGAVCMASKRTPVETHTFRR